MSTTAPDQDTTAPPAAGQPGHAGSDEAGRLLARGFPSLMFPRALERQYQQHGARRRLRHAFLSGALSLLVFNGFLLVDYMMVPDVLMQAIQIRLGLFTPAAMVILGIAGFAPGWVLRIVPPWGVEAVVMFSGMLAAASVVYILSITHSPLSAYYHVGLLVVLMYGNIVQRLRFWFAVALSAAIMGMHLWCVATIPISEPRLTLPLIGLLAATAFFTLMSNHALEYDERRRYLLSLRRKQLLAELDSTNSRLHTLSRVDGLTGVFNRHHAQETLDDVWRRAAYERGEVSIVLLDVDHFKKYNDRHGHQAGDECLRRVAQAMKDGLRRPHDLVARFGGEEFIAVLPHTDGAEALQAAERIRGLVEALALPHGASATSPVVTASLGVGTCRASPALSAEQLIEVADQALYKAKHEGRNRAALARLDAG